MKTPIIAVSSTSIRTKNSFTRSLIDFHEISTHSGIRKVVRTTSHIEMPSTPRW